MTPRSIQLGSLKLTLVGDGEFRLDGGAVFGVVPKVLWERQKSADERNRIRMATNCLLVERGSDLLLVDVGIGDKNDAKFRDVHGMPKNAVRLPEAIRRAGYELGDVSHVLPSHLHFDHCGWNTRYDGDSLVPTFPRACYWLQRDELAYARRPGLRDRSSFDPRNWEPLFDAGVVELFDDGASPIEGVTAVRVPGHTADMCVALIDGGYGQKAVFWADLVPTTAHVAYPWVMSFDLDPVTTIENKREWLPRAAEEGWLCVFDHEADEPLGRLEEDKPGRYRAQPVSAS